MQILADFVDLVHRQGQAADRERSRAGQRQGCPQAVPCLQRVPGQAVLQLPHGISWTARTEEEHVAGQQRGDDFGRIGAKRRAALPAGTSVTSGR